MQSSPVVTNRADDFINSVQERLQTLIPDALCETEQFGSSVWLNVTVGPTLWTVEHDVNSGEVGLTCVSDAPFTTGHDEVFSVQTEATLAHIIVARIQNAQKTTSHQQKGREKYPVS